jgi:hypothetical protein
MSLPPLAAAVRRCLTPSLVDVFFCGLLAATCAGPGGWTALLADGDTGWHIRTGEMILATGAAPAADPYSFTRPGERWFAWEWLADVLLAWAARVGGLRMVAAMCGVVICLAAALLLAWMLRRGVGLWIGLTVTLAAASASTVHALARPHVFSILLYTGALWVIDEDRRRPGRLVWLLAPAAALWANLHAGFVALLATLLLLAAAERSWRYAGIAAACAAATLVNPYGWRLHAHIVEYLRSPWILEHVQEFQSPNIRSENMLVFAVMLLAAAALALRGSRFDGLLALVWGFAALRSARHVPFCAIAAAPVIATGWARMWRRARPGSAMRVWWQIGQDLGGRAATAWTAVAALGMVAAMAAPSARAVEFPATRFPARAVERNAGWLVPAGEMPRILTSDQWADYLIYKLYPRQRVFFDGRSDFYGPSIGADYRELLDAGSGWRETLQRYGFARALLPREWPLATMLESEAGWRRVYEDDVAVLFVREALP